MKADCVRVFSKCLECNEYLSGQQKKFCCCWCKDIHITRIKREYEGNKQLTKIKREARAKFIRLNSSAKAFKQIKTIMTNEL